MFTFYVTVRHTKGMFLFLQYKTDNEILTEIDLMKILEFHADTSNGVIDVQTEIISWQRLNV